MKVSEFKININKKMTFKNGEVEVEKTVLEDKEVNFKELNMELMKKMFNEIMSKITDDTTENEILFLTLPYLTDIEIDIPFEEFDKMVELPSKEFCMLCDSLIDEIGLIIDTSKSIVQLNKKSVSITKKFNKLIK
jgi:hypothetical protein